MDVCRLRGVYNMPTQLGKKLAVLRTPLVRQSAPVPGPCSEQPRRLEARPSRVHVEDTWAYAPL